MIGIIQRFGMATGLSPKFFGKTGIAIDLKVVGRGECGQQECQQHDGKNGIVVS